MFLFFFCMLLQQQFSQGSWQRSPTGHIMQARFQNILEINLPVEHWTPRVYVLLHIIMRSRVRHQRSQCYNNNNIVIHHSFHNTLLYSFYTSALIRPFRIFAISIATAHFFCLPIHTRAGLKSFGFQSRDAYQLAMGFIELTQCH